jgi:hypothetical protein
LKGLNTKVHAALHHAETLYALYGKEQERQRMEGGGIGDGAAAAAGAGDGAGADELWPLLEEARRNAGIVQVQYTLHRTRCTNEGMYHTCSTMMRLRAQSVKRTKVALGRIKS